MTEDEKTQALVEVSHMQPAVLVNKFAITANDHVFRIAFFEQTPMGTPVPRGALAISRSDAVQLRDALSQMLSGQTLQ